MYNKAKNAFFDEIASPKLLKIPESLYSDIKQYVESISKKDNVNDVDIKKINRVKYYSSSLLKVRLYKIIILNENPELLIEDEKEIYKIINNLIDTTLFSDNSDFLNNFENIIDASVKNYGLDSEKSMQIRVENTVLQSNDRSNGSNELSGNLKENFEKLSENFGKNELKNDYSLNLDSDFQDNVYKNIDDEIPKVINTERDIHIVRVNHKFPYFTDGNCVYGLNKNDLISLDGRFSKILEKHNIVEQVTIYENEKEN
ncbi:hypothetical protein J2127_000421 [Methanococcus voltae]|uniref:DNA replication complex GINS family protein n=1 Tax=Methanococcus voltae TaxID=2188 RepID=UPI001AE5FF38|nr:DNA replication complex GINS family protein [Methanococcus voltae]MBP2143280.1 hypothetical protein [Methanococcus voltae]